MVYPLDFPVPTDSGGPGAGAPIGGFGGNPGTDQAAHRAVIGRLGRSPVLLVHGNGGAADVRPWDLLDQRRFLLAAGYVDELIWAPSYLGPGSVDLQTPHTNNVDDVRDFLEAVCAYLAVDAVDVIAHSLGCTLMYAVFRGLERQTSPVSWAEPKKWHRVGTFVALAGAFHGLGGGSLGEWRTGGEFMTELLAETDGGGGETPYAAGGPHTPPPTAHNISYFCGTAAGDFIDAQNPGTGRLDGAVNRSYNLGSGTQGHQAVKENQAVFDDFLPLLNSVPPVPAATITLSPDSGTHPAPLTVTVGAEPTDIQVDVSARRLTRQVVNGSIVDSVAETRAASLRHGGSITLDTAGFWQLSAAAGASRIDRSYWVGVEQLVVTIVTDNGVPFDDTLLVTATTSDPAATIHHSLDGTHWTAGATVTIGQDSVVSFLAVTADGNSSDIVSRTFSRRVTWDDAVTASAANHFIAGRIDVAEYLAQSERFGFFTPFTLYLVGGRWVLDPQHPDAIHETPASSGVPGPVGPVRVASGGPQPGRYPAEPLVVTLESVGDEPLLVNVTRDGSIPEDHSPSFLGHAGFEVQPAGQTVISCRTVDGQGVRHYQVFPYSFG